MDRPSNKKRKSSSSRQQDEAIKLKIKRKESKNKYGKNNWLEDDEDYSFDYFDEEE